MDLKMIEKSAPMALGDEMLATVAGGYGYGRGHWKKKKKFHRTVEQSNTVGDITVNADGNSGTITLDLSQSNSVA